MQPFVNVRPLPDSEVDESLAPMWTSMGLLRHPRRRRAAPKADGSPDFYLYEWDVPDMERWMDVPGFPDFLLHPELASPNFVRAMTPDERRAYEGGKVPEKPGPRTIDLVVEMATLSIVVNGVRMPLSPREHELLVRTIEESPLSHKRAVQYLEAVKSKSPGGVDGFVDARALADHRKGILAKVEQAAGLQTRLILGEAFKSKSEEFVYDARVLPYSMAVRPGG